MFNTATLSSAATVTIGTAFIAIAGIALASPAHASAPAGFQSKVEAKIDSTLALPANAASKSGIATVAVAIDGEGKVLSTTLVSSAGTPAFDAEALRTARTVSYPATGKSQTVAMVLGFNRIATAADAARGKSLAEAWRNDSRRLLASETPAQPIG